MARWETHQTDGNAKRLYAYAEALGMSVAILNRPVDAAVGFQGISALVEVKRPGEKLRPNQKRFFDGWCGLCVIWQDEDDVERLREAMRLLGGSQAARDALLRVALKNEIFKILDKSVASGRPKG
jgi:hypothetical protein